MQPLALPRPLPADYDHCSFCSGKLSAVRIITRDAYGHGPVPRTITAVAGRVRHGNSGGPAVDATGSVEATIFAQRVGSPSGYGVPASLVRRALDRAKAPVSTGGCAAD